MKIISFGKFLKMLACAFSSAIFLAASAFALSGPFDHSEWGEFLKTHVNEQGEVNYAQVRQDRSLLNRYLDKLAALDGLVIKGWPREERLALYLNAYHAALISNIVDHYPVKSTLDIPGFSHLAVLRLGGDMFSLNQIKTDQLINAFRDEKIHLALSCGARGCPRLKQEPFTGPKVEAQLFLAAREFVNDSAYNRIQTGGKKIWISRIFKWYAKDFRLDFGFYDPDDVLTPEDNALISFLIYYVEDSNLKSHLEEKKFKIKYLPFDWTLNDASAEGAVR